MNDYDIAEIYKDMELHLIRSMRRNLGRHLKEEEAEGFKWKAWQAEKLKELKRYQRQNKDIINAYTRGLPDDISKILKDEFKQGNRHEINRYNKLFDKDMPDGFFKLDDRKVNALIKVVNNDLSKGNHACLRMINDTYRKTIHRAAMFATTGTMTTKQAVDMATKDFLNRGLDVIEYKDGRRVNIASYSQMAVRTASQRAMLMGEAEFRKEMGEYLVIISRHGTACELCKPHETKVYVDDVYANGKPDGKHRMLSEAMEEGLFHPNCRHGVNTYYDLEDVDEAAPTDDVPIDNDDPEVSRIDVAMRKEQRKVEGCLDKGNRDKAREKLKELEAEKESVIFGPAQDLKEVETRITEALGTKDIKLNNMNMEIANGYLEGIEKYTQEYPELKGFITTINTKTRTPRVMAEFGANATYHSLENKTILSGTRLGLRNPRDVIKYMDNLKYSIKTGFNYDGINPKTIAMHELTHAIEDLMYYTDTGAYKNGVLANEVEGKQFNYGKFAKEIIEEARQELYGKQFGRDVYDGMKHLGSYALTDYREGLAEAISYEMGVKTSPYTAKVKEIFDRKIKEVLKNGS